MTDAAVRSPLTSGRYGCRWRHSRTESLFSSLHNRFTSDWSSTKSCRMKRLRYVYRAALWDRCACCKEYEVSERKALIGEVLSFPAASADTRLKQKTLFAFAKS